MVECWNDGILECLPDVGVQAGLPDDQAGWGEGSRDSGIEGLRIQGFR